MHSTTDKGNSPRVCRKQTYKQHKEYARWASRCLRLRDESNAATQPASARRIGSIFIGQRPGRYIRRCPWSNMDADAVRCTECIATFDLRSHHCEPVKEVGNRKARGKRDEAQTTIVLWHPISSIPKLMIEHWPNPNVYLAQLLSV